MNSTQIMKRIYEIQTVSSKNEKVEMLQGLLQDGHARKIFVATYHPLRTYGVDLHESPITDGTSHFCEYTFELLNALESRKLSGNAANAAVTAHLMTLTKESSELFFRILRHTMYAGFDVKSINAAYHDLIPTYPYMRCSTPKQVPLHKLPWHEGVYVQEKYDGMFVNVTARPDGQVEIVTRQGQKFPRTDLFSADKFKHNVRYSGELLVMCEEDGKPLPREVGNGILNSLLKGGELSFTDHLKLVVWDGVEGVQDARPYCMRYEDLKGIEYTGFESSVEIAPTGAVYKLDDALAIYNDVVASGKEGVVLKTRMGIWKDGTSKEQVKLKMEFDCDLEIIGFRPGKAGTKLGGRIATLTMASYDGKVVVEVPIKGEKMRNAVEANREEWTHQIMTVKSNGITQMNDEGVRSLVHPRFVEAEYRSDKETADTLDDVLNALSAANGVTND